MRRLVVHLFPCLLCLVLAPCLRAGPDAPPAASPALQDYFKAGQLEPLPDGVASLYRAPWRSNPRTASAYDAAQGMGVYYKHIQANENVMKQMAAAGVKRLRLAPHHTMYIHKDWTGPTTNELDNLKGEFKGCKAAGIRPCVVFVHIPVMGTPEEADAWLTNTWKKTILTWGAPGSDAYKLYMDKTYLGLLAVVNAAREAGFTAQGSYDIEMGQNLWWGFPALPPFPGLKPEMLRPGGLVYEFEKALIARLRQDGYAEPTLWNSESYHYFDKLADTDNFPDTAGRAISVYSPYGGTTDKDFTGSDAWPTRAPLTFAEGTPPAVALCKPEGWMADFSRRDCMIPLLQASKMPVALTSLGVVPADIPGAMVETTNDKGKKTKAKAESTDGWLWKSKGLTRSYAFWLNQGVPFVLIHSAYEGADDEMSHALIPNMDTNMNGFVWQQSKPLTTLHAFAEALAGAKKLEKLDTLAFRYALAEDTVLIPASEKGGPLKASDAVALLTYQLDAKKFAVAAYVVTPTISVPMKPVKMTLQIDKAIRGDVHTLVPVTQAKGKAEILSRAKDPASTTVSFDVRDDVTWLVFEIRQAE